MSGGGQGRTSRLGLLGRGLYVSVTVRYDNPVVVVGLAVRLAV